MSDASELYSALVKASERLVEVMEKEPEDTRVSVALGLALLGLRDALDKVRLAPNPQRIRQ